MGEKMSSELLPFLDKINLPYTKTVEDVEKLEFFSFIQPSFFIHAMVQ